MEHIIIEGQAFTLDSESGDLAVHTRALDGAECPHWQCTALANIKRDQPFAAFAALIAQLPWQTGKLPVCE